MAEIIMPKMGDAMTEGRVVKWYKKEGDSVSTGEPVLEIETDKVNLDLEAEEDGVIESIDVEAGQMVDVGTTLATIGSGVGKKKSSKKGDKKSGKESEKSEEESGEADGTSSSEKADSGREKPASKDEPKKKSGRKKKDSVHERKTAEQEAPSSVGRPKSSPLARKIADRLEVDLNEIVGSGPRGRIIASDVQRAAREMERSPKAEAASGPPVSAKPEMPTAVPLEDKIVSLTAMRRTIAKRLSESTSSIPHFYLTIECDVTSLLDMRSQLIELSGTKVSVNDFVVRAAALAVHHHPYVNASFGEEAIEYHGDVHVGIAVATEEGLITPVIRDADGKSVVEVAGEIKELAGKARSRKLKPDEYQGSTLTISNLGMYGIDEFTAIINPPNAAILAVSAATTKPVVIDGEIVVRERMKVTMSCDHRVIDGAAGAEFLKTFKQYLEQPLRLLM